MADELTRFEIDYRVNFKSPRFELATSIAPIIEKVYSHLVQNYRIELKNIQAVNAMNMAEVGLDINLFNGSGAIMGCVRVF